MRILSYNIHKGIGGRDRRYEIDRVIEVILSAGPDLVCLQEVDCNVKRTNFDDQPKLICEALGAVDHLFQLNVPRREGGYGNLIASKHPFVSRREVPLKFGIRKNRAAQCVTLRTPAGQLRLVNWHLGLNEKERHWQVYRLLESQPFLEVDDHPTLIVGDTNDWRNNLENGPFREHGYRKLTRPPSRFRTFPAYFPMGALDKAFARDLRGSEAHVFHSRLAREASDHLPLIVDLP